MTLAYVVLQAQSGARTGRQWRAMSTGIEWVADKPAAVLRQDAYANTTSTQDDQQYANQSYALQYGSIVQEQERLAQLPSKALPDGMPHGWDSICNDEYRSSSGALRPP